MLIFLIIVPMLQLASQKKWESFQVSNLIIEKPKNQKILLTCKQWNNEVKRWQYWTLTLYAPPKSVVRWFHPLLWTVDTLQSRYIWLALLFLMFHVYLLLLLSSEQRKKEKERKIQSLREFPKCVCLFCIFLCLFHGVQLFTKPRVLHYII